ANHIYEMAVLGYFSHGSPNRASFAARLACYYTWHGYPTWHVGETLLWSEPALSARAIVRLWLHSPEHRRELLDPRFREVGIDTAEETNARFRYLLEHGQTGLSTAFDMPTLMGYDSDHARSLGEVGREGVAIDSLADMETLFGGIPLDEVSTSMTINSAAAM